MSSREIYIEERPDGRFAVLRRNAKKARFLCDTQSAAIRKAKELVPGAHPDVERVKHTKLGNPPKWRSATRRAQKT